ncbi:hypothetical protein CC86DRAFT_279364 [Ophiobolus disseminans]|uniref:Uncharacterized protein n=1 Tax=Ophiobolus disseminans TaxID=1469910 RepID=A0A6A7AKV9_9PLEO|nr:hypothetical protein CC86DRAFT_279364 [Ophiobolus disseminans]
MTDSNETTLLLSFGIITILATLAGLHYRDSLCYLCCRTILRAWQSRRSPGRSAITQAHTQCRCNR